MQDKFLPPLVHKPPGENPQFKYTSSKALRYERFDSLKTQKIDSKKVTIETDIKFMQSIELLTKYQSSVLDEIIGLKAGKLSDTDCERIHFKAKRHSQANMLNLNSSLSKEDVTKDQSLKSLLCKCGCEKIKGDSYALCSDMGDMNILGSGVLLFFFVLKTMAVSLIIFICIFDLFAVITNLKGIEKSIQNQVCTSTYCSFRNNASDISKFMPYQMQIVQGWLGLAAMAVWIFASRVIKKIGNEKNLQIDNHLDSKSDYSIKISNLPYGQYSEQEILQYMLKLSQKLKFEKQNKQNELKVENQAEASQFQINTKKSNDGPLNIFKINQNIQVLTLSNSVTSIRSIQIIYNMEFSRKMIEKINNLTKQIKSLIIKQNSKYVILKKDEYWLKKNDLIEVYELFEDLRKKFLNDTKFRKSLSTRVTIIQFNQTEQKVEFLKKFGKENLSIFKQIKQKLLDKCFGNESELIFKGSLPEIVRAPQPSDVIWQNCEKKQSILRMVIIYSITFILIMISLGIMVGLEYGQNYYTKQSQNQLALKNENISTILNIIVSLSLQIINAALWVSLQLLLDLQYNHTFTNKIISQMNKSAVATWINIIILPIIVNYFINDRYYGSNGLSGIVFDYHISALTVGLVVKLLDPVNLFIKLAINIKCIRNGIINAKYRKTSDQSKISEESMKNVYRFYEAPQFNIAQFYNYILSNILHAVFFCTLQPFILILALLEVIFFYWICKFKIFRFCKIPKLTQKSIFEVALVQFTLVPIFYGVGAIYNSYVAYQIDNSRDFNFIGSAICIGLGLLSYFNPKNSIQLFVQCIMKSCSICFSFLNKKASEDKALKNIRMQNYFKNCNSLSLLGFENILRGNTNSGEIEKELKDYCENHVRRYFQHKASDPIKNDDQNLHQDNHQLQSSSQND